MQNHQENDAIDTEEEKKKKQDEFQQKVPGWLSYTIDRAHDQEHQWQTVHYHWVRERRTEFQDSG